MMKCLYISCLAIAALGLTSCLGEEGSGSCPDHPFSNFRDDNVQEEATWDIYKNGASSYQIRIIRSKYSYVEVFNYETGSEVVKEYSWDSSDCPQLERSSSSSAEENYLVNRGPILTFVENYFSLDGDANVESNDDDVAASDEPNCDSTDRKISCEGEFIVGGAAYNFEQVINHRGPFGGLEYIVVKRNGIEEIKIELNHWSM